MKLMKMKVMKWSSLFIMAVAMTGFLSSCNDVDTKIDLGEYSGLATSDDILFNNGTQIGNGDQEFCFTGKQTITKGTYTLKGWVYGRPGAELTIEPGTIIKGDKATMATLIVEPGGKIYAEGTASSPIVFTSNQAPGNRRPGDWGGLIVCGYGTNNNANGQQIEGGPKTKHGGNIKDDNSGVLRYIRVEFAGYPFQTDKEINGITFGSVGSGTTVSHLMVSYCNDDSYEWFGGSVNCKYLVAYNGWDDEFDTDNGFDGHVQYCLSIRDPRIADISQSNGFESDNNADGSTIEPYTAAVFSNVTFIGPMTQKNLDAGFVNNDSYITAGTMKPENSAALGKFQSAMHIRRSSKLNCYNTVALGYPIGLIIDGEKGNCQEWANNGSIKLQNVFFAGMAVTGSDFNKKYEDELGTWSLNSEGKKVITYDASQESFSTSFLRTQSGCRFDLTEADLMLTDPKSIGQVYCPSAGSPLLNAANFNGLNSSFIQSVSYIGAFSGPNDNWLEGWTSFDPQNTVY